MKSDYQLAPYSEDALPSKISPEGAKIANTYLENACNLEATARVMNLPKHEISAELDSPLVKKYLLNVMKETGLRNLSAIADKMDDLVKRKWEELEEAEMGSNKDIAELLTILHKMRMDSLKIVQEDTKSAPTTQTNIQTNIYGEGNYGALMSKLLEG